LAAALGTMTVVAATFAAPRPEQVKLAFWNIKSGQGAPGVRGHAATFVETNDCDPAANKPMNAWGVGVVPRERQQLRNDPAVVALGLAEAWNCASPGKVMRALGWKHHTEERNGTGLITRYGIAGRDEWIQLDTSRNKNPKDSMYVVRAAVCLDAHCGST